jgi:hypothetical protein
MTARTDLCGGTRQLVSLPGPERPKLDSDARAVLGRPCDAFPRLPCREVNLATIVRFWRVCHDESDAIINDALRRLTVRGSRPDKNTLHRRIKCGRTRSRSQR